MRKVSASLSVQLHWRWQSLGPRRMQQMLACRCGQAGRVRAGGRWRRAGEALVRQETGHMRSGPVLNPTARPRGQQPRALKLS